MISFSCIIQLIWGKFSVYKFCISHFTMNLNLFCLIVFCGVHMEKRYVTFIHNCLLVLACYKVSFAILFLESTIVLHFQFEWDSYISFSCIKYKCILYHVRVFFFVLYVFALKMKIHCFIWHIRIIVRHICCLLLIWKCL